MLTTRQSFPDAFRLGTESKSLSCPAPRQVVSVSPSEWWVRRQWAA